MSKRVSITYSVVAKDEASGKEQTIDSYTWKGLDPVQRFVVETVLGKVEDLARKELLQAGLANALSKGEITKEEVAAVQAFEASSKL